MKSVNVLIIDDDVKLNRLLTKYLAGFGFTVTAAEHPAKGLRQLRHGQVDIIILDVMLPDMDGFEVCRTIRRTHQTPIIMLTARGDVTDRIVGLEIGADDYLPKPFEPRELVARIQTVLRRAPSLAGEAEVRSFGGLSIDLGRQQVTLNERLLELTTAEFQLLVLVTDKPGRVFSRDQLLSGLHGTDWDPFNRSIDVLMSRLRRKLGDSPRQPDFIKTVWGSGYTFIGESNE